jgi:hypothetical protein
MLPEYSDNISLADIKNLDKYCKDDVRFNIENIKFNKNFLSIRGWMLDRNITSSKIESKYVVFQNKKNNKMYSLPLENVFRNDVTKSLSNGTNNFDWSGFRGADVLSLVDGYYDVYLVKIIEKEVFAKKHIKSLSVKEGFYEL